MSQSIKFGIALVSSLMVSSLAAQNVRLLPDDSLDAVLAKSVDVRPTPRQIAWQRDEFSAFIHFGMKHVHRS